MAQTNNNGNGKVRDYKKMPEHYKDFNPRPYMRAHDLKGKSWNMKISVIKEALIYDPGTKKNVWRSVIFFATAKKYLIMSEVIGDQIASATDCEHPADWIGKVVCLHAVKETHGGKVWDVIRIKKAQPKKNKGGNGGDLVTITPAAEDLIREYGLDQTKIKGTGAGGTILKKDVEDHIAKKDF